MLEDLHIKYRPQEIEQLYGQEPLIKSLKKLFKENKLPHVFLFEGSSGCGKTTTARIIARKLGVEDRNIIEMDVATKGGIDDSRALIEGLKYQGFGKNPKKFIILDEVHAASKAYWQSLLKTLEDTPAHVYFALCTTESGKVPETIRTRCTSFLLKSIKADQLFDLLSSVAEAEGISDLDEDMLYLIAKESGGSARQALVNLNKCRGCKNLKDVKSVLESVEGDEDMIALCRALADASKPSITKVVDIIERMKEKNAESARIVLTNYLLACTFKAKKDSEKARFIGILSFFRKPYYQSDKMAPLLIDVLEYLSEE